MPLPLLRSPSQCAVAWREMPMALFLSIRGGNAQRSGRSVSGPCAGRRACLCDATCPRARKARWCGFRHDRPRHEPGPSSMDRRVPDCHDGLQSPPGGRHMPYTTHDIRNVALAGHPGAGKTTLFEALLHAGGVLATAGSVERGNTVSDSDPLEKQRGHSLDIAIASIDLANGDGRAHLNFIDTPGYPDFRGPALSALSAVETALVVVDADTGVEHGTLRLMERARERGLCRAIVVNK